MTTVFNGYYFGPFVKINGYFTLVPMYYSETPLIVIGGHAETYIIPYIRP